MKDFSFRVKLNEDDPIIKTLERLNAEDKENLIRKALYAFIGQSPTPHVRTRETASTIRPEPHGYPVE